MAASLAGQRRHEVRPQTEGSRTIRSWGSAQMAGLMRLWERGFHREHPEVRFEDRLHGTVSAMAGLYSGAADLALMGREIWPTERLAFQQMMGYSPSSIEAASGSFDVPTKADALVIFVHRDNPLSCLSLRQLDGIFGAEHRSGGRILRTWGDLGLGGGWQSQPIQPYGYRLDNAAAIFFRNVVMKGSLKWNPAIREFGNRLGPGAQRMDSGRQILDALAGDRFGIGLSNPHYAGPEVKPVSLRAETGGSCVAPTRANVRNRSYPLARAVYLFFARQPGHALDPTVAAFLKYVVSDAGQQAVAREGAYLPLPGAIAAEQLNRLEALSRDAGQPRRRSKTAHE
jgi:phosphate transport system substrate-binding protein